MSCFSRWRAIPQSVGASIVRNTASTAPVSPENRGARVGCTKNGKGSTSIAIAEVPQTALVFLSPSGSRVLRRIASAHRTGRRHARDRLPRMHERR